FDLHEGTASFVIENQKGAEFSVVAGDYRVVVVGTRFTVGYVPPKKLSVLVKEGAVNVVLPERSQPVLVGAGEQLTISGDEFSLTGDTDVSTDEALSDDAISGTSVEQNPDSAKASPSDGWKEL